MSFSLLNDAWIPALAADGARAWITPAELTERNAAGAARWIDLDWGRPDLRVATYELLIGLFAVALAPRQTRELFKLLNSPPDGPTLAAALAPLAPYLTLDGEGPRFQQDIEAIGGDINPPDALFMDAQGEGTFFVKAGRFPVLSRKAAAIALHALQSFAPSGGRGHRTSMRGGGPLTTLVVPDSPDLWRRVAANLPILSDFDEQPPDDLSQIFPWAGPTRVSRAGETTELDGKHHTHWLQHYFGMPRRIRLRFAANAEERACALTGERDSVVVDGFYMESYGVNYGRWRHPLTPYYEGAGKELLPLHPRGGRILYRDWVGYQFARTGDKQRQYPARCLMDFLKLDDGAARPRLLAAGYVTDNMKTKDYVEADIPVFVIANPSAREFLAEAVYHKLLAPAELAAGELRRALVAALGGDFKKTIIAAAIDAFWIATEAGFRGALSDAAEAYAKIGEHDAGGAESTDLTPVCSAWLADLREQALRIFWRTAPLDALDELDDTHRQAVVDANKYLFLFFAGASKSGQALYKQLQLPLPQKSNPSAAADHGAMP